MKPDWKDAPEWAKWVAMDDDGDWYWYEEEPIPMNLNFVRSAGRMALAAKPFWRGTLEAKP